MLHGTHSLFCSFTASKYYKLNYVQSAVGGFVVKDIFFLLSKGMLRFFSFYQLQWFDDISYYIYARINGFIYLCIVVKNEKMGDNKVFM